MNAIESPLKTQLFTHFARVAKALVSPVRPELLEALAQSEHSVDELARGRSTHGQRLPPPGGGWKQAIPSGKPPTCPVARATRY
nr:hypothetical protein [Thioalkalivibrio sp.]